MADPASDWLLEGLGHLPVGVETLGAAFPSGAYVTGGEASEPAPRMATGYQRLYHDHVQQADAGCDFDFLVGRRGAEVPRESH